MLSGLSVWSGPGAISVDPGGFVTLVNVAETVTFNREDIKSLERLETSLMPPGLQDGLTSEEVADLVSYLRSPGPVAAAVNAATWALVVDGKTPTSTCLVKIFRGRPTQLYSSLNNAKSVYVAR